MARRRWRWRSARAGRPRKSGCGTVMCVEPLLLSANRHPAPQGARTLVKLSDASAKHRSTSLPLKVVAEQQFLIAEIEPAVGDDRRRPDLAARQALLALLRQREATLF